MAVGVIGLALLWSGCASTTKEKLLTFIFPDGYPPTQGEEDSARREQTEDTGVSPESEGEATISKPDLPTVWVHEPYLQRKCSKCHESKYSQKLRYEKSKLCISCHDKFLRDVEFIHAPVVSGDCLLCHNPHKSSSQFLLVETGPVLCYTCHDPLELSKTTQHDSGGYSDCTTCHDPHQGSRKFYLKPAVELLVPDEK